MNLGFPKSIDKYIDLPFDGIGVFRIEFMIATYIGQHPGWLIDQGKHDIYTDKLFEGLSYVAEKIHPKPMVVRFSDFKTNEYRDLLGGTEYELKEENPMMGWRGASRFISEKFHQIFRLECQSILKLRENFDNIWVMIPFVRTVSEAQKCLDIMKEEGLKNSETFKIWLMAETPAIALLMEEFNKLPIDGYSIGSNDLCQLVLGVDRDHSDLAKMGYFDERNPAVVKAIEMIINGAHKGNKTCSICGECVSQYIELVDRFVALKVDSLSVNPSSILKIRDHLNI